MRYTKTLRALKGLKEKYEKTHKKTGNTNTNQNKTSVAILITHKRTLRQTITSNKEVHYKN